MKHLLCLLIVVFILTACNPIATSFVAVTPTAIPSPTAPMQITWWKSAVFYEIFVRSFYDTNGDGIGDFNGITEKLDYLNDGDSKTNTDLGVTGIWLMPIHPSPSYHGYDVTDYYAVNPDYGTMNDFKNLLEEAHKRGIKVILDLVLNHTSNQHPWFSSANNDLQSSYRNWYIWSEKNPGYSGPMGAAWHPGNFGYYYGLFDAKMPDLNYNNPAVTAEMEKVVRFWLKDVGVDGFRIDAAKHLIEEGQKQENTQPTHEWFKGFYKYYKALNPDAYTVGEVAGSGARLISTYTGDQMDMVFSFEMASGIVNSAKGEANSSVNSAVKFAQMDMRSWQFATFLTNHDQNRVMTALGGNLGKAKVAASLLLTAPGTPFIYYGEEIGMEGQKPDEDIRLPMQWTSEPNTGFTTGKPWRAVGVNFSQVNVNTELRIPDSLINHYRQLLTLRSQHPALQQGSIDLLTPVNPGIYAALRTSESETILIVINLTKTAVKEYNLSLDEPILRDGTYKLKTLFGTAQPTDLKVSGGMFADYKPLNDLPPYSTYIFQVKP